MTKKSRYQSLKEGNIKEAIFGVPEPTVTKGKVIISKTDTYGRRPSTTFRDQVEVFEKDPIVRESIVHMAQEVVSGGIFTILNEKYKIKLPNGEGKNWTAKEAIDYFNEQNNMDEVLFTVALELVAYGNSFMYITDTGIKFINIEDIGRALPHKKNVPLAEEFDIQMTGGYYGKRLKWGSFIHFRSIVTSSSEPYGTGVVSGLIESYDADTPSLLETRNGIRGAMLAGFQTFGQPKQVYSMLEMSDEKLDQISDDLKAMEHGGIITVNTPIKIEHNVPERVRGYDAWVETEFDEFVMALANPSLKASVESGFTEASIKGSIELFQKKVQSIRRVIKRLIEKLWFNILTEYGFDAEKANIKLNFGSEIKEYDVADILTATEKGIITKKEARKLLIESAKWKIEDEVEEEVIEEPEPIPEPEVAKESAPLVVSPNITIHNVVPKPTKKKITTTDAEGDKEESTEEITYETETEEAD